MITLFFFFKYVSITSYRTQCYCTPVNFFTNKFKLFLYTFIIILYLFFYTNLFYYLSIQPSLPLNIVVKCLVLILASHLCLVTCFLNVKGIFPNYYCSPC